MCRKLLSEDRQPKVELGNDLMGSGHHLIYLCEAQSQNLKISLVHPSACQRCAKLPRASAGALLCAVPE